jgi:hypothetical protein
MRGPQNKKGRIPRPPQLNACQSFDDRLEYLTRESCRLATEASSSNPWVGSDESALCLTSAKESKIDDSAQSVLLHLAYDSLCQSAYDTALANFDLRRADIRVFLAATAR